NAQSSVGVFLVFLMNPFRKTISPSCTYTKNNVRAIRFGNALRISQRADPFCEPAACREARCQRAKGDRSEVRGQETAGKRAVQHNDSIIFDTLSKQDLRLY